MSPAFVESDGTYKGGTVILRHLGLFTITFPDGSILKHCRHRAYQNSGVEWYLFYGRQFDVQLLARYGATIEREAE